MGKILLIAVFLFSGTSYAIIGPIPGPIPLDHPASYNTVALVKKAQGTDTDSQKYRIFCSGLILADNLILTAKHCIGDLALGDYFIYFGDDTNNVDERLIRVPHESSVYGPTDWQHYFPSFDSAWVKIKGTIPNADGRDKSLPHFRPVPILTDVAQLKNADAIYMAGYGNQDPGLMKVVAGEKKHVATGFKEYLNSPQVVSLTLLQGEVGHSNCHGDSGGPSYAVFTDQATGKKNWYIFGTAAGFDLALTPESYQQLDDEDFPYIAHCDKSQTLYTFVGDYVNWIEQSTGVPIAKSGPSLVDQPGLVAPTSAPRSFGEWCERASYLDSQWLTVRQLLITAMEDVPSSFSPAEIFMDCSKAEQVLMGLTQAEFDKDYLFGSLEPLAALSNVKKITFNKTSVPDLTPFINSGVQRVILRGLDIQRLEDVSGLLSLKFLEELEVSDSRLSDISPLVQLQNLIKVNVSRNEITDISSLKNINRLREVNFAGNQVADMSPLYSLSGLEILVGSNNKLVSMPSPDGTWMKLREVFLINNQLTDLDFLRDAKNIERSAYSGNPLQN